MGEIKVLLVDDHKIIRDGVKLMLDKEIEIDVSGDVDSAEAALIFLSQKDVQVNLMVVDINMPGMNGIELASIVNERFPRIKILALTRHAEHNYINSMINAGALGYVLKESGQEELITAIKKVALGEQYFSNQVSVTLLNKLLIKENNHENYELSERETEVLKLIALGKTNKEAGELLFVSPRTIETHRRMLMEKLELKNIAELVLYAVKRNIIDL